MTYKIFKHNNENSPSYNASRSSPSDNPIMPNLNVVSIQLILYIKFRYVRLQYWIYRWMQHPSHTTHRFSNIRQHKQRTDPALFYKSHAAKRFHIISVYCLSGWPAINEYNFHSLGLNWKQRCLCSQQRFGKSHFSHTNLRLSAIHLALYFFWQPTKRPK